MKLLHYLIISVVAMLLFTCGYTARNWQAADELESCRQTCYHVVDDYKDTVAMQRDSIAQLEWVKDTIFINQILHLKTN